MNAWIVMAGLLVGSSVALLIHELVPAGPSLRGALQRLDGKDRRVGPAPRVSLTADLGHRLLASAPWLPRPAADLRLLGVSAEKWLASKLLLGLAGLSAIPVLSAAVALDGRRLPWSFPVAGSLLLGCALFLLPDVVTRINATKRRRDFRHALMSYLDLVVLERGAGAAPTEALEAAAQLGGGWAFERIAATLDRARSAGHPPWDGLAQLAADIGVAELADLAAITGIAGNEGARILDSLASRAESMRAEAQAAAKAQAGARSTTMVLPIALLAGGFMILLIFPDFYRIFG